MTIHDTLAKLWDGQTVAVLASGPSLTKSLADSVRQYPRIAARRAVRLAPDADMLIALDAYPNEGFWDECRDFAGLKICGCDDDRTGASYLNLPHERIRLGESHVVETRNNGLAAIRVAEITGAARILLLGFDPERHGSFYDDLPQTDESELYPGLTAGLEQIITELRAKGIAVERIAAPGASDVVSVEENY